MATETRERRIRLEVDWKSQDLRLYERDGDDGVYSERRVWRGTFREAADILVAHSALLPSGSEEKS